MIKLKRISDNIILGAYHQDLGKWGNYWFDLWRFDGKCFLIKFLHDKLFQFPDPVSTRWSKSIQKLKSMGYIFLEWHRDSST
jgi:hypothetical protein